ncbi:MAG: hypothetical protein LAT67_12875 [Balneolales bacterium]|nr:hypothetical protein [Balneolales bacterium]
MKHSGFYIFLAVVAAFLLFLTVVPQVNDSKETLNGDSTINALIGDQSYIAAFGTSPTADVTDSERIVVHLSYVEELLRNSIPEGITQEQKEKRLVFLDHLREYRVAGNFPVNDDHPDKRRPTFISNNGHICAVGYLVEQSAGRAKAERINKHYKYSYIKEIDDPYFLSWAEDSGFTITELAMIQPSYWSEITQRNNVNKISAPYAVASSGLLTANAVYWSHDITGQTLFHSDPSMQQAIQWAGLAVGTGTILFGALNLRNHSETQQLINSGMWTINTHTTQTNHLKTSFSAGHIFVGAATVLRSAWHLLSSNPQPGPTDSGVMVTNFALPDAMGVHTAAGLGYRFNF